MNLYSSLIALLLVLSTSVLTFSAIPQSSRENAHVEDADASANQSGTVQPANTLPIEIQFSLTATDSTDRVLTVAQSKAAAETAAASEPDWVKPMQKVHAGFQGSSGYVAQLGDSITYSMAFWTPIGWDDPQKYLTESDGLPKTPPGKRWRDVIQGERDKGPQHGNYSGWTAKNLVAAIDKNVLEDSQPEMAIIMVGTNDISGGSVPKSYESDLEYIVEKCLAAHCVPVLNTIPPRRGHDKAVRDINEIIKRVAQTKQVPLVDFHAAIVQRRPDESWDGTLISKDGVHPSGGKTNIYAEANLKDCGYALRNWLNFLAVREVYFRVLHPKSS